ncbi:MAG: RDD family protein [Ignavibacteriae bacterium HGW-Ignavibacteriae-2]|jgi:uncharacterized RDD family membrane protein YckC|nr:MAG: RDD family protein [Ignavibacteriae bacterium HGW-Ignavibacteriae-2]
MSDQKNYAGFWKRFVAHLIDKIILSFIGMVIFLPLFLIIGIGFFNSSFIKEYDYAKFVHYYNGFEDGHNPEIFIIIGAILLIIVINLVISFLYYVLFESSAKQATPGKMILNLVVADLEGNKISFARAAGRYFGKILSGLILGIGYIIAAFTAQKQALHDVLAGCLVLDKSKISYESFTIKEEE